MSQPFASLSLDLDDKWTYLKTHGVPNWQSYPSYLGLIVPRVLEYFRGHQQRITFFVVGQDAVRSQNIALLGEIAGGGHEIGNHSFHHEPWLHEYSRDRVVRELESAEQAIQDATGKLTRGFRGPGFSFSPIVLEVLAERGYTYDASTFPTFLGPIARAYYFFKSPLSLEQRQQRRKLFGGWREGFRSLRPYYWPSITPRLLEIPVTTIPCLRVPFHLSYLIYLASHSRSLCKAYFGFALRSCRLLNVTPSFLLHPLDFLGGDEVDELAFFPGMNLTAAVKVPLAFEILDRLFDTFTVGTMHEHAARCQDNREAVR